MFSTKKSDGNSFNDMFKSNANKSPTFTLNKPSTAPTFIYDSGSKSGGELSHQVKYGPGVNFSPQQSNQLQTHYGDSKVLSRYTQYNPDRETYSKAAIANGRGLTIQEHDVHNKIDPGPTSIDHIIASGTGQQALNTATLLFREGNEIGSDTTLDSRERFKGFAKQAVAVGRMRGLGRDIIHEETKTEGYGKTFDKKQLSSMTEDQAHAAKRNKMAKDLSNAFEKGDLDSYKSYMKHTFDSTGNLRLGHSSGNSRVSTGFDMPLDQNHEPTQQGRRLLNSYQMFGFENMQESTALTKRNNAGLFTTNAKGSNLSSSKQVSSDTVLKKRRVSERW